MGEGGRGGGEGVMCVKGLLFLFFCSQMIDMFPTHHGCKDTVTVTGEHVRLSQKSVAVRLIQSPASTTS